MTCKVLFTAVAFVPPGTRLGLVGSTPELGSWDCTKAVCLTPQQECYSALVPTCFSAMVELRDMRGGSATKPAGFPADGIRFKFIRWREDEFRRSPVLKRSPLVGSKDEVLPDDFRLPNPEPDFRAGRKFGKPVFSKADLDLKLTFDPNLTPPSDICVVQWEGNGPHEDRFLINVEPKDLTCGSYHVYREDYWYNYSDKQFGAHSLYLLPVYEFLEPHGGSDQGTEYHRTTRYYFRVRDSHNFHFQTVLPGIFVGSCPRAIEHLRILRDTYHVGLVFNLQTHEDILKNWIDDANTEGKHDLERLQEIYWKENLSLIHLPTEDMSTPARASLMAQTAALMAMAVASDPTRGIYIHCNAGVGRAVATVCSFLRFVLGLSEAHTATLVKLTRTVAYPDLVAMRAGLKDFSAKYKPAVDTLPLLGDDASDKK